MFKQKYNYPNTNSYSNTFLHEKLLAKKFAQLQKENKIIKGNKREKAFLKQLQITKESEAQQIIYQTSLSFRNFQNQLYRQPEKAQPSATKNNNNNAFQLYKCNKNQHEIENIFLNDILNSQIGLKQQNSGEDPLSSQEFAIFLKQYKDLFLEKRNQDNQKEQAKQKNSKSYNMGANQQLLYKDEDNQQQIEKQSTIQKKVKIIKQASNNTNTNNNNIEQKVQIQKKTNNGNIMYDDLPLSSFSIENVLGQGSYAVVKLATEKQNKRKVGIKIYEKYKLMDVHKMNNVKREIEIMRRLNHPNIIELYYVIQDKRTVDFIFIFNKCSKINLIMEYGGNYQLSRWLKQQPERRIPEQLAKSLFKQLVSGIAYGHSKNVIHRDIKLDNILLDDEYQLKIIDYGFSIIISNEKKLNVFCGTPSYMAPEIIEKMGYRGQTVDCWALGICLYAMLCGAFPFKGYDDRELFRNIKKGKVNYPEYLSGEAQELLAKILVTNPNIRLSANQILEDKWFEL